MYLGGWLAQFRGERLGALDRFIGRERAHEEKVYVYGIVTSPNTCNGQTCRGHISQTVATLPECSKSGQLSGDVHPGAVGNILTPRDFGASTHFGDRWT